MDSVAGFWDGCPGADVEAFKAANRAPLYAQKWNRWVLVRTLRDDPSPDVIKDTLAAVFQRWFSGDPWIRMSGTTEAGNADLIRLVRSSREPILVSPVAKTSADCDPVPLVVSGPLIYLEIEFVYRGKLASIAWPAWRSGQWCPVDADWILWEAAKPETARAVPGHVTVGDRLAKSAGEAVDRVGDAATRSLRPPLFILGAAALLFAWRKGGK